AAATRTTTFVAATLLFRWYIYSVSRCFFFFNDTATTEIYTLSLHDALPISRSGDTSAWVPSGSGSLKWASRSEEHTSELQSHLNLVCRLLLEKKKKINH